MEIFHEYCKEGLGSTSSPFTSDGHGLMVCVGCGIMIRVDLETSPVQEGERESDDDTASI